MALLSSWQFLKMATEIVKYFKHCVTVTYDWYSFLSFKNGVTGLKFPNSGAPEGSSAAGRSPAGAGEQAGGAGGAAFSRWSYPAAVLSPLLPQSAETCSCRCSQTSSAAS